MSTESTSRWEALYARRGKSPRHRQLDPHTGVLDVVVCLGSGLADRSKTAFAAACLDAGFRASWRQGTARSPDGQLSQQTGDCHGIDDMAALLEHLGLPAIAEPPPKE